MQYVNKMLYFCRAFFNERNKNDKNERNVDL